MSSFATVVEAMKDPFLAAKLHFFSSLASQFEPFLRRFQHEKPMIPFLHGFLISLVTDTLKRFVKASVMQEVGTDVSKIMRLDLHNVEILKETSQVDLGFGAKRSIPKNPHPRRMLEFGQAARSCLTAIVDKILERSPLKYELVKGAASLSPPVILTKSPILCEKRFDNLLNKLIDSKCISLSQADSAKQEYSHFIQSDLTRKELQVNFVLHAFLPKI